MRKIKSFGCSFISGVDLGDFDTDPRLNFPFSKLTWPALIAEDLGVDYHSVSRGGAGNLAIMHWLLSSVDRNDLVIVNWTYIDRFDYVDSEEEWKSLLPMNLGSAEEFYYRNLQSQVRDQLHSLGCIAAAISFLKTKQIPFLMTYMDQLLMTKERNPYHNPGSLDNLQSMVSDHLNSFDGVDFLTWSRSQGLAVSEQNHPLESAHRAAADYFIDHVAFLLKIKNSLS